MDTDIRRNALSEFRRAAPKPASFMGENGEILVGVRVPTSKLNMYRHYQLKKWLAKPLIRPGVSNGSSISLGEYLIFPTSSHG